MHAKNCGIKIAADAGVQTFNHVLFHHATTNH